jgi:hypothetical protein
MRRRATGFRLHAPVRRQIRLRGARRLWPLLAAFSGLAFAMSASAVEAEPGADDTLATLCGIVETSAKNEGLPVDFFTGLIWRESAFRANASSPAGAKGVAQFMPGTASDRGLADPFDPATAIPASAKLLAELVEKFGNLGLAAAAYNAGPKALVHWLAGKGIMPSETRGYVKAITGRAVEEWRAAPPSASASSAPAETCLALIGKLEVGRGTGEATPISSDLFAPWGVQISASFSKESALRAFARVRHDYASVIGGMAPFVLGSVLPSRGPRPFYRVRLPARSGGEAERICDRLRAAGGACAVMRS